MAAPSSSLLKKQENQELDWLEWLRGWSRLLSEGLFQKVKAKHLPRKYPLPQLSGLSCMVTGATSGIGLEIARQLAESGAHVVMAVRNPKAAHQIIEKWNDRQPNSRHLNVDVMEINLLSLESVVKFAESWNSSMKPLHVLINNAGIFSMGEPQKFSRDGYETHLQVNHLAPALLSVLLLPSLQRGAPSRIVNVNSLMNVVGFVDPNDMNFFSGKRKFTSSRAYSGSKLAQVMFTSILARNIPQGIDVLCVEPGSVRTNVARDLSKVVQIAYQCMPSFLFDAQQGSRSPLFAAIDPDIPKFCGKLKAEKLAVCAYFSYSCRPIKPAKAAYNEKTSDLVWEKTLDMVGLPSDAVEKLLEGKEIHCRYGSL
ncbi:dehydrogenase/reductase SDR family member FEY-like [Coffea eugenioides]|uniref:dehydrogenase/reductase SDR family member FEY-like n=1 Tax=Coffea eugenioides TaxID=49369 RepID=UPI000F6139F3|nr:dehydrogenase/reductase SDR family member FEY-like [Coffea eugenioides]